MIENIELIIDNNGEIQQPNVLDGISLQSRRTGSPAILKFDVLKDELANFQEGNPVRLVVDGVNMFYGFVFKKRRDKGHIISVTAYDQMRYLKNKDTLNYTDKTASDVIRMIATKFDLQVGSVEETSYIIPERNEPDTSLFDIIYDALNLELTNTGNLYVFYDDFGELTLKALGDMKVDLLIDEETGENFDYESSIDDNTYNRVKLVFANEETGMNDVYEVQHGENINRWGLLQYYGTLQQGENGVEKANALLDLFNAKTRRLKIINAIGDLSIRAGSMPVIKLNLGDITVQNYMLVESCTHTFNQSEHFMDLVLRGGEFVG